MHYENGDVEEHNYDTPGDRITRITISLKKSSNPKEVVLKTADGRAVAIRIYNADAFKRLVRGGRRLTTSEVLRAIESRHSADPNEIILLLSRLIPSDTSESDVPARVVKEYSTSRKKSFEPPKKSTGDASIESIAKMLDKTVKRFLKTKVAQKNMEIKAEDVDEGDVDTQNEKEPVDFVKYAEVKRDYMGTILRHLKTLWNELYVEGNYNRNLEIATIIAEIVLRIILRDYEQEFFMKFEEIIEEYLKELDTSSIDQEVRKNFFFNLLKLHYISNYKVSKIFIRDLFDYRIFTDPEVFNEIKSRFVEFIQGVKENLGKEFNEEKFMILYGNLVACSLSPSSVSSGVRTLVKNLVYSNNQDVKRVSYYTLLNLREIQISYSSSVKDYIKDVVTTEKLEERILKLLDEIAKK